MRWLKEPLDLFRARRAGHPQPEGLLVTVTWGGMSRWMRETLLGHLDDTGAVEWVAGFDGRVLSPSARDPWIAYLRASVPETVWIHRAMALIQGSDVLGTYPLSGSVEGFVFADILEGLVESLTSEFRGAGNALPDVTACRQGRFVVGLPGFYHAAAITLVLLLHLGATVRIPNP